MRYTTAEDAAECYIDWAPHVQAQRYDKERVQTSRRPCTTPPNALAWTELERVYASVRDEVEHWTRKGGRLLWICYWLRRLQHEIATPSYASLTKVYNRLVTPDMRISKATMRRRLMDVDKRVAEVLEERGLVGTTRASSRRERERGREVDEMVTVDDEERDLEVRGLVKRKRGRR